MKKIPTLFKRGTDSHSFQVRPELNPECEWVRKGTGLLSIKIDGQNVRIHEGKLERRLKPLDADYTDASYVPCDRNNPMDQYLFEAFDAVNIGIARASDGIYEAYGPKINGNPQRADNHFMVRVCPLDAQLMIVPSSTGIKLGVNHSVQEFFDSIKAELMESTVEGFVFHYEPVAMKPTMFAKIKRKDFGLTWPIPQGKELDVLGTQVNQRYDPFDISAI